jgi:hypothetical protein
MTPQEQKIERLIQMAEKLMAALESDIEALKAGQTKTLKMIDPDIQRLSIVYSREMKSLDVQATRQTPPSLRQALRDATDRFRDLLKVHMRHLTRVRNASEGIIQAIARDVEKKRVAMRPYSSPKSIYRPQPTGAIVYNNVV